MSDKNHENLVNIQMYLSAHLGRVFNENPRDLWDNAPTVERKLNRSGYESPLGDPCPAPCAIIPWSPEEPTIENILRAETKEPIDPPPVITQPQPVPKPSPKNKPPAHWLLCEPRPEKPARHAASQYYDDRFEAIPLHHLNSRHLDKLTDETLKSDSREPPKHRSRVPHCECVTEDYANICEVHTESQIWKCLSDLQPPTYRSTSARVLPPMTDCTRPRTRIRDNLIDCDVNNSNM